MKVRNTTGASLADANLSRTDLRGAILRGANLTGAVLTGFSYDPKRTLWPDGFAPPANTPR